MLLKPRRATFHDPSCQNQHFQPSKFECLGDVVLMLDIRADGQVQSVAIVSGPTIRFNKLRKRALSNLGLSAGDVPAR